MSDKNFFLNTYKKNKLDNQKNSHSTHTNHSQPKNDQPTNEISQKTIKKYQFEKISNPVANNNFSKVNQLKSLQKTLNKENNPAKLTRRKLSAIYLVLNGIEKASSIVTNFTEEELFKIINEILSIEMVTQFEVEEVEKSFGKIPEMDYSPENLAKYRGGKEYVRDLLIEAFGTNQGSELFIKAININNSDSIQIIESLPAEQIIELLKEEGNMIIAAILTMLSSQKAAEVISQLKPPRSIDIVKHMSSKIDINSDALSLIIEKLRKNANELIKKNKLKIAGKNKLLDILKQSDIDQANNILTEIEKSDPGLAFELRDKIFTFNDIVHIPRKEFEKVLKEYPDKDIAFILKGATDALKMIFFSCISKKRRRIIEDEIIYLGKVKKSEVDIRRRDFVKYILEMESNGELILNPDKEIYVE
ncbi:MAG: hypothetical protein MJB14_07390 [Spirochaetes bacterium]|nr:hypothetical protein [Spirochaetota bacterium]